MNTKINFEKEIEENINCVCGNKLTIDVFETDDETGAPTESGYHFWCGEEPYQGCGLSYQESIEVETEINNFINKLLDQ